MGLEVLFWIWVLTWMAKTAATDVLHAVKGTPNPRYELKKQRAAAAGRSAPQQPRYGTREWAADLYSDALAAHTEKRRQAAKAKAEPVDDMVDVVREPAAKPKAEHRPVFRHETPEPPVLPPREEKPDPSPEHPGPARTDRQDAPPSQTVREPKVSVQSGECEECGEASDSRICPRCKRQIAARRERARELDAQERGPAPPRQCPDCGTTVLFGTHCKEHADAQPIAPVIQMFPNPKHVEKEITMASSEVTGLSTAIAFAEHAAKAHSSFATAGTEGYTAALAQHGVGDRPVGLAREAQEASQIAAAKWQAHADALKDQVRGKEFYQSNPDAGDKQFLLAE